MEHQTADLIYDLHDVGYTFTGRFTALRSVELKVRQAERVVVVGTNGSGKSTLLHILGALLFATNGEARAYGRVLSEETLAEASFTAFFRRRVGLLFQNPDVQLFCPTVLDEIAFGPLQLGASPEEALEKSRALIEMLGLQKISSRPPFQLSGGEKKKVALAAMLSVNPDVLLLDEPTGGLDPRTQVWLVEILGELHRLGKTIVTATHDLSILEEIADRAVVMEEGHTIVADRSPGEILDDLDLLLRVNLIHEHVHSHADHIHSHGHLHFFTHRHKHGNDEM
jgi:cobalt/nickel transport system ATP-binding protein